MDLVDVVDLVDVHKVHDVHPVHKPQFTTSARTPLPNSMA